MAKVKVQKFIGKPIFDKSADIGYICFSGKKWIKKVWVSGYFFKFWGSKTWRFLPLKTMVFLANNFVNDQDYGTI